MMIYPEQNHGVTNKSSRLHLYSTMRDFLLREIGPGAVSSVGGK